MIEKWKVAKTLVNDMTISDKEENEQSAKPSAVTAEPEREEFDYSAHPDPEGVVECHWCKDEFSYSVELKEGKENYTVRCPDCKLKVWIQGEGIEKYKKLHSLSEGCEKEDHDTNITFDAPSPSFSNEGREEAAARLREYTRDVDTSDVSFESDTISNFEVITPEDEGATITFDSGATMGPGSEDD